MYSQFKDKYEYKRTVAVLFVLTLVFGAAASVFEILAFPLLAAWFAALFVFSSARPKGIILPCVAAAAVVALGFLTTPWAAFTAVTALVSGLIIGLMFLLLRSKPECVTVTLVAFLLMTAVALWILASVESQDASFASVKAYYTDLYADFRASAITALRQSYTEVGSGVSAEEFAQILELFPVYLDNLAYLSPSVIAIVAFLLIGIAFKIFIRLIFKYSLAGSLVLRWRFTTTNVFVIFYLVLALLNVFLSDKGAFAVSVLNLYTFFNFLYAYVGYNFAIALLTQKMRYGIAVLIVVGAVMLFSSLAFNLLAIGGVVFTFISNKSGGFGALPRVEQVNLKTDNESENDNEKD